MIQIPGYFIKREVGTGGMATVYLAVQTSLEREVALKVMTPALVNDPNFSRRFLMEARTLASLSHPNIVAVYDVGVTEAQLHYFSMQHLPRGDFVARIRDGVTEPEVMRVLSGVARALAFAHLRGFVHRDVSPANILFDATDNPILTDFGIARAVTRTSRLTNAGVSVGTSHYMSPEQARGGAIDARSDIYSLGAVAYEALTGKPPYDGEDGFAIAYAHVFEPIPRLPAPIAHWQELIDRALAKDPAERFPDMDSFVASLERIADKVGLSTGPRLGGGETLSRTEILPVITDTSQAATTQLPQISPAAAAAAAPASVDATQVNTAPRPVAPASVAAPAAAKAEPSARRLPLAWLAIGAGVLGFALAAFIASRMSGDKPPETVASNITRNPGNLPNAADVPPRVAPTPTPAPETTATATTPEFTATDPTATALDPNATETTGEIIDPYAQGVSATGQLMPDGTIVPDAPQPVPLDPAEAEALRIAVATTAQDPLPLLLAIARNEIAQKRLGNPPGRNAFDHFKLALQLAERFKDTQAAAKARQGIADVAGAYVELGEASLKDGKTQEFLDFLKRADEIATTQPEGADVLKRTRARREQLRDQALAEGRVALTTWNRDAATKAYQRALVFDAASAEAQRGLKASERLGLPGYVFRDGFKANGQGPEMVVVDVGGKRLAFARAEVTLGEFRASGIALASERTSCRDRESFFRSSRKYTFENPNFTQTANHPVVCVTFTDAENYAEWLTEKTGKTYRLPTAAEWKALAARLKDGDCKANVADQKYNGSYRERDAYACDDGYAETAPVRSFEADSSGVYDIGGNVREWVSDCAPGCKEHVALGRAWLTTRDKAAPTQQETFASDVAANTVGFRVVREVQ